MIIFINIYFYKINKIRINNSMKMCGSNNPILIDSTILKKDNLGNYFSIFGNNRKRSLNIISQPCYYFCQNRDSQDYGISRIKA